MKTYTHLTTEERITLMLMQSWGLSLRAISRYLGRYVSSLAVNLNVMAHIIAMRLFGFAL